MLRKIDSKEAGASARQRYREEMSQHLREHWRLLSYFPASVVVALLAAYLLPSSSALMFFCGAMTGIGLLGGALAITTPPRLIGYWLEGAEGEQLTAERLQLLEPHGWIAIHDRALARSNVDHVLVGPGGVIAIDTKKWRGTITVKNGVVRRRRSRMTNPGHGIRSASAHINNVLKSNTSLNPWVTPAVVFWADFPQDHIEDGGVMYIRGETLTSWLFTRETVLKPEQIQELAAAIRDMPDGIELGARSA